MSGGAYTETSYKISKPVRRLIWGVSIAILIAGVVTALLVFARNTAKPNPQRFSNAPVKDVSKNPKSVKLDPAARRVAGEFILTAVARKNLRKAYELAGPQIREGMSLKEWLTGNIPVVPYPADAIDFAPMKVDFSYPRQAQIEVALLPKQGYKVRPTLFVMGLIKVKDHWLVNSWVPRVSPVVPSGKAGNG